MQQGVGTVKGSLIMSRLFLFLTYTTHSPQQTTGFPYSRHQMKFRLQPNYMIGVYFTDQNSFLLMSLKVLTKLQRSENGAGAEEIAKNHFNFKLLKW